MDHLKLTKRLTILIRPDRKIIGVKFIYSEHDWSAYDGKELKSPVNYCVAVKLATSGQSIKMRNDMCACIGSERALGFKAPTEEYINGSRACNMGLFSDQAISAGVSADTRMLEVGTLGVVVKPLDEFEREPDIVMVITDSYGTMRIMQGYTNAYGMEKSITMTGNQAICVECTTNPYLRDDINVSALCSGTRFYAGWKNHEIGIGIPYTKFEKIVAGVRDTVNAIEMDPRKQEIIDDLNAIGDSTDDLELGHTYYYDKRK